MTRPGINLIGRVFGQLTVLTRIGARGKDVLWLCECSCGQTRVATTGALTRRGGYGITSCGCRVTRHGHGGRKNRSAEYNCWHQMKDRCEREKNKAHKYYGARGIRVCDRWRVGENGRSGFECFLEDIGLRPSKRHSIDRFPNNNGHYEPDNVRWATTNQQARNKRPKRTRAQMRRDKEAGAPGGFPRATVYLFAKARVGL